MNTACKVEGRGMVWSDKNGHNIRPVTGMLNVPQPERRDVKKQQLAARGAAAEIDEL